MPYDRGKISFIRFEWLNAIVDQYLDKRFQRLARFEAFGADFINIKRHGFHF